MSLDSLSVSSIMSKEVKTESENQNIMSACKVMRDNDIGCVVVVNVQDKEKTPVGIITERDIIRILGQMGIEFRTPLTKLMSKPIVSIRPNSSIREAIQLMNSNRIRRLIVVDGSNRMVGIVTEKDLFREISRYPSLITGFVGENYPAEHREVYARFTDYMFDLLPKV
ncbi:MAG: CBS domain-containing protein [Candidatus Eiseniibacteriota bacterium]